MTHTLTRRPDKELREAYDLNYSRFQNLKEEVLYILNSELNSKKIPFHIIEGRVKSFESFKDKVKRKECKIPFEDIQDICGIRIICLFQTDIEKIDEIINSKFIIHKKDDKIFEKPEDSFGYLSVHYIGSLLKSYSGPRYDDLKNIYFEIQVRTIAMHAWSTISHYLAYKTPHAIPTYLRKDFNALSALFYIVDSHFELFFRSSQEAQRKAEEKALLPSMLEEEVNLNTVSAFLRKKYPDRQNRDSGTVSELVEELVRSGYNDIAQIESALQKSQKAFEEYEKKYPPETDDYRLFDVGVVRVSLSILDDNFLNNRNDIKVSDLVLLR